jgi:mannonate dehydratase
MTITRRALLGTAGATLATPAFAAWPQAGHGMPVESADTPHICLGPIADSEINPAGIRRYTQLGLSHIILNGGNFPWDGDSLKAKVKTLADNGLKAGDIGLPWSGPSGKYMRDIIYARPGRDKAIEDVKKSIRAASAAGIPIVEYNFYVHRANEGYFDHPDPSRGSAGVESFDYKRMEGQKPLDDEIVQEAEVTWANLKYFLDAVGRWRNSPMCGWRCIPTIRPRPSVPVRSRSCPPWRDGNGWWVCAIHPPTESSSIAA